MINDINAQSSSPGEDGAVGLPGDAAYSSSSIIASAINTNSQGPMAFVAYQAPVDFARLGAGGGYKLGTCGAQQNISDDQLICRTVSLQIQITSGGNTSTQTIPVTIVRPPVILVHGLWGEKEDWNKFSPLYTPAQHDFRFFVQPVNYNRPYPQPLRSLDPTNWAPNKILTIKYNSLGFEENAKLIGPDIRSFIQTFKQGVNPANVAVAAIQADIVAHSMGGVITRTLVYLPNYLDPDTLQQGIVHKLITIDTPHLGSELAAMLLQDQNYCTRGLFASVGMVSANVVTTKNGQRVYGAVGDLQAGSIALSNIALPGVHKLPTALIAGVSTSGNFPQDCVLCTLNLLGDACGSDPLMQYIFQGVWPQVFNGADSDSIVSVTSQLNNLGTGAGTEFRGVIHSSGIETLNFVGPTVLDSGQVPNQVILFLNTPVTQSLFNPLNP